MAKLEAESPPEAEPDKPEFDSVTKRSKRIDHILEYVREHPGVTRSEIAEAIGCPHTGVYYPITKLTNMGYLRAVTDPKDGKFRFYSTEGSA